jgi:hypothetical protein
MALSLSVRLGRRNVTTFIGGGGATTVVCGLLLAVSGGVLAQELAFNLEATLATVGEQLDRHYQRSESIVSTEMVTVRSFRRGMRENGPSQRLEFERRVEWGAFSEGGVPTVTVFRELRSVNGREPTKRDLDACLTPRSESEDPLVVLLPMRQREFQFSLVKLERIDGRQVARLGYVPREEGEAEVVGDNGCVSISLPGWSRGEVWVDVESGDVLRLDEHLTRQFDFRSPQTRQGVRQVWLALELDDLSIRYERVIFKDPVETVMLPRSIERSWVLRGDGFVPRYYRIQELSNHRRYVTGGRLVEAPGPGGAGVR